MSGALLGTEIRDRGTAFVLDASALLALLHREPGAAFVELVLEHSVVSAVNWSEVVQKAEARGTDIEGMREELLALGLKLLPFEIEDAEKAARLWEHTRTKGLSLGDRACLATAFRLGIPALTADRDWKDLKTGVEIELVR